MSENAVSNIPAYPSRDCGHLPKEREILVMVQNRNVGKRGILSDERNDLLDATVLSSTRVSRHPGSK